MQLCSFERRHLSMFIFYIFRELPGFCAFFFVCVCSVNCDWFGFA